MSPLIAPRRCNHLCSIGNSSDEWQATCYRLLMRISRLPAAALFLLCLHSAPALAAPLTLDSESPSPSTNPSSQKTASTRLQAGQWLDQACKYADQTAELSD